MGRSRRARFPHFSPRYSRSAFGIPVAVRVDVKIRRSTRHCFDVLRDKTLNRSIAFNRYPPQREITKISLAIAVRVARKAYALDLARERRPENMRRAIEAMMYRP